MSSRSRLSARSGARTDEAPDLVLALLLGMGVEGMRSTGGRHQPKHRRARLTYGFMDESDVVHILGAHLVVGLVLMGYFLANAWISCS